MHTSSADRPGRYGQQLCDRALIAKAGNNTREKASGKVSVTTDERAQLDLTLAY